MTLALIPLITAFVTGWLLWVVYDTEEPHGLGLALVKAMMIQALIVLVLNEILSLGSAITRTNVALGWLVVTMVQGGLIAQRVDYRLQVFKQTIKRAIRPPLGLPTALDRLDRVIVGGIILVLGTTLATALIAPPNNWDSMTYHMPRVMHWLQNQSIAHYPTPILRQISFPPGNAALISHLQLLSGGDSYANLVQWLAFVGGLVIITQLTQALVPLPHHPWLGSVLYLSIPMALMQAPTTQNDLLTAFWLSAYAFFILVPKRYSHRDLVWVAISLGLAIATKPTAFIYGFPLGMVFAAKLLLGSTGKEVRFRPRWLLSFGQGSLVLVGALGLSLGTFLRNYHTFTQVLGDDQGTRVVSPGVRVLISNAVKNLYINLPIPPVKALNVLIHHLIGYDIYSPNSDLTVSLLIQPGIKFLAPHEDFVGAPIHSLLVSLGVGLLGWVWWQHREQRSVLASLIALVLSILASFGLFCWLLKWSPWHNRLLLPLVILAVPGMAFGVSQILKPRGQRWLMLLLIAMALAYSLTSLRRPILPLPILSETQRTEQSPSILTLERQAMYFSGARKEMAIPYQQATAAILQNQCRRVGLALGSGDYWEYPFWALLNPPQNPIHQAQVQLKHIGVANPSATLPPAFPDADLCTVIALHPVDNPPTPNAIPAGWQPWYETTFQSLGETQVTHQLTVLGRPYTKSESHNPDSQKAES